MIKLSGAHDIEIIETGLRPGEKLYEELLIKSDTLTKTDNDLIFIEKDTPLSKEVINEKLQVLKKAIENEDDNDAREALRSVVPTFRRPEESCLGEDFNYDEYTIFTTRYFRRRS